MSLNDKPARQTSFQISECLKRAMSGGGRNMRGGDFTVDLSRILINKIYIGVKFYYETKPKYFGESKMLEAINYELNYMKEFKAFLSDVSLPLTNNDAERALRHSVLGRKNFNGSKTINGADKAASLYTVIESCKKAELDPSDYLKYLIRQNNLKIQALTPLQLAIKQNQKKLSQDTRLTPNVRISALNQLF